MTTELGTLLINAIVGFVGGLLAVLALAYFAPLARKDDRLLVKLARRVLLHQAITQDEMIELHRLLKTDALIAQARIEAASEATEDATRGEFLGLCACGCGEPVYYLRGRKPKYVSDEHRKRHFRERRKAAQA